MSTLVKADIIILGLHAHKTYAIEGLQTELCYKRGTLGRQACGHTKQVIVYTYGARSAEIWWATQRQSLKRLKNLSVTLLPMDSVRALPEMTSPAMQLQWTIQDGHA
jgi:uncharacterized protein YaeQ